MYQIKIKLVLFLTLITIKRGGVCNFAVKENNARKPVQTEWSLKVRIKIPIHTRPAWDFHSEACVLKWE